MAAQDHRRRSDRDDRKAGSILTLLFPGSVDTLATMAAVVAAYYFACSLVALKYSSRRAAVLVVSIAINEH
jgi:hypothetical protein